jgi:bifunctional DNA-binding transcriptional regulator/antitoxin component of YhaV-PrlF toxin-antitoxin module
MSTAYLLDGFPTVRIRQGRACIQSNPLSIQRGGVVATSYVMKVSGNGQVSIPAEARARWNAERVVVVDLGDRVVLRPLSEDPVGHLTGKYRRGPSTDAARRRARANAAASETRKRGR